MNLFRPALFLEPIRGWTLGAARNSSLCAAPLFEFAAETEAKPFAAMAARPQARAASDVVGAKIPRHGRRLS